MWYLQVLDGPLDAPAVVLEGCLALLGGHTMHGVLHLVGELAVSICHHPWTVRSLWLEQGAMGADPTLALCLGSTVSPELEPSSSRRSRASPSHHRPSLERPRGPQ